MDRRTLFRRTALGSVLLVVGGSAILATRRGAQQPDTPSTLAVLDATTFPILVAVAEAVCAVDRAAAVRVATRVDEALTFGTPATQRDIKRLLLLVENALAGLFLRGQPTVFSTLAVAEREAGLLKLRDAPSSTVRGGYLALRKLCRAAYFSGLEEGRETGYPGPPFEKPDPGPIDEHGPLSPPFVPRPPPPDAPPPVVDAPPVEPVATADGGAP